MCTFHNICKAAETSIRYSFDTKQPLEIAVRNAIGSAANGEPNGMSPSMKGLIRRHTYAVYARHSTPS